MTCVYTETPYDNSPRVFSIINHIDLLSLQHLAFRSHCMHVQIPWRRQMHVPLPCPEKGSHEQQ